MYLPTNIILDEYLPILILLEIEEFLKFLVRLLFFNLVGETCLSTPKIIEILKIRIILEFLYQGTSPKMENVLLIFELEFTVEIRFLRKFRIYK